ncbi:short-chain dehydrogenase [Chromatiales bacterium (ex Bugula neritina AB1)]|nr:short-chain dehydrogenase [Chromatiales bacterium (ex Bugula neritina AB1)]
MDLKLKDKTILVTGASRGIGYATALAFAREGAIPVLVSRSSDALELAAMRIKEETSVTARLHVADLTQDSACEELHRLYGSVDVLVNNAGAVPGGRLHELSMQEWRSGWELKVFGYIHLCKLFSASMFTRKSGTILNIIGMGGRSVRANYICGAAGNAALIGFTQALGNESASHNVRVFGINPSPTATERFTGMARKRAATELGDESRWGELIDGSNFPFGRLKTPQEVASLSVMLCSSEVQYLSGTVVDMDGGQQWR